ncbi:hypothetical protein EW146_g6017 [Bondarzewia mesenterica]|uniref:2-dehydropantoate 2-reductase n=1 Tax=Bondarzewia mesenterica TaxID=1095465 RepID=A0A4S4LPS2_9AGAM|nr:hypothetical protein EW146_g6017 [Bondarzewia mesenterica]
MGFPTAIGTFYALVLERSGRARVTAVFLVLLTDRDNGGIKSSNARRSILHSDIDYVAVARPEDAADRKYDFVVCTFKALPDVMSTSKLIGPLLSSTNNFVLIQNGIGIHADLQEARPDANIISSCAWIDVTTLDGGRSVVQSGSNRLTSGLHAGPSLQTSTGVPIDEGRQALQLFHNVLVAGGAGSEMTDDIEAARWQKILWNASISTLCTVTRGPVADLLAGQVLPATLPVVKALMTEIITVARKSGVSESKLPVQKADQVIEDCLNQYSDTRTSTPSQFKPSMLVDLEAGRPMEVEPILGGVVKIANKHGVETPRNCRASGLMHMMITPRFLALFAPANAFSDKVLTTCKPRRQTLNVAGSLSHSIETCLFSMHLSRKTDPYLLLPGFMMGCAVTSIVAAIFDVKHYLHLQDQYWRLLVHHLAYSNSSELFIWELILYNVGVNIERQFGSVKFGSYAVISTLVSTILEFLSLLVFHRFGFNNIPSGPTTFAFNLLYQYSRLVPSAYQFRIFGVTVTSKIFVYILAFQLAISQPPSSTIVAVIGLLTGALYRTDIASLKSYRLPPWFVRGSLRFLLPLVGSTRAPRRTNRALPDDRNSPSASDIAEEVVTTARPRPVPSGTEVNDAAGTPGTSVMREWVNELTGRGERAAAGLRVPTEAEIAQLTSMFPDVQREVVVGALQRRYIF